MKVKNKDIVAFLNGIRSLKNKRLPVKVTYAINKNIKAVSGAAEAYNNTFEEIRNRYICKDENGKIKTDVNGEPELMEGKSDEFVKEMEELREIENDVKLIMLTYSDLEKCDSDRFSALSVADMETLSIMME